VPIYEENPVDITDGAPSAPVTTTDESVRIVDFTVSTPYCANARLDSRKLPAKHPRCLT
jgi:hypothetical protein